MCHLHHSPSQKWSAWSSSLFYVGNHLTDPVVATCRVYTTKFEDDKLHEMWQLCMAWLVCFCLAGNLWSLYNERPIHNLRKGEMQYPPSSCMHKHAAASYATTSANSESGYKNIHVHEDNQAVLAWHVISPLFNLHVVRTSNKVITYNFSMSTNSCYLKSKEGTYPCLKDRFT